MCVVSFSERVWEYRDRFALNLLLNKEILTNLAQVPRDKKKHHYSLCTAYMYAHTPYTRIH